jgi:hypothetical protein
VISPSTAKRNALLFAGTLVATFVALRIWLGVTPNADFNVLGYNIHHLFTGVLLVTATAIPLVIGVHVGRARDVLIVAFGAGMALVLDEWVYLIVTPGTNADYLLPVSFWGGVAMVGLGAVYALIWGLKK